MSAPVPPPTAPPSTTVSWISRTPTWVRGAAVVTCLLLAIVGGYVFYSDVLGLVGCECPTGYYLTDPAGNECSCVGTSLTCKYNCGDGQCFANGEGVACADVDQEWAHS